MKFSPYILATLLTIAPVFASDSEEEDKPSAVAPATAPAPAQEQDRAVLLASIEDLEVHFEELNTHTETFVADALEMYGIKPEVQVGDKAIENSPEARFLNAIPCSLISLNVKPRLTFEDLLKIRENKGMRTLPQVFFSFLSRCPGDKDITYALSDCTMLATLTPDMSAYCTIMPFLTNSAEGLVMPNANSDTPFDGVEQAITASLTVKKTSSRGNVKLVSGQDPKPVAFQAHKAAALCPFYRLYKGEEPIGVFALVTFKIEAQDRAAVIAKFLPGLQAMIAKKIRKADRDKIPDFKSYMKQ